MVLMTSCQQNHKRPEPDYFKNLYTEEILNEYEFAQFYQSLKEEYYDSIEGFPYIGIRAEELIKKEDSIILPFKYDVRVGKDYKVRSRSYDKIGMNILPRIFKTIEGDSIQIGGNQEKPTVINLWFTTCGGCIAEMPALNRLQEKYADKVNFIAITGDDEKDVLKFLRKKNFNYKHIASKDISYKETSMENYIKYIGSYPYPENIFIDRKGTIRYVEGILPNEKDLDVAIQYFESIIEELLQPIKPNLITNSY